jgi:hypothetical protein
MIYMIYPVSIDIIGNKDVGWVNGFQYRCFGINPFNYQKTVIYST